MPVAVSYHVCQRLRLSAEIRMIWCGVGLGNPDANIHIAQVSPDCPTALQFNRRVIMWEIVAIVVGVYIGRNTSPSSSSIVDVSSSIPISEDPITPYFISLLIFMFVILPAMQIIPEMIIKHRKKKGKLCQK